MHLMKVRATGLSATSKSSHTQFPTQNAYDKLLLEQSSVAEVQVEVTSDQELLGQMQKCLCGHLRSLSSSFNQIWRPSFEVLQRIVKSGRLPCAGQWVLSFHVHSNSSRIKCIDNICT